jgi:hypothetical protein
VELGEPQQVATPDLDEELAELSAQSTQEPEPRHRHDLDRKAGEPMLIGTVTDPTGEPVHGAIVTIADAAGRQIGRLTLSAGANYFTISDVPDQYLTIVVSAPKRMPAVERVLVRSDKTARQEFTLHSRTGGPTTATFAAVAG